MSFPPKLLPYLNLLFTCGWYNQNSPTVDEPHCLKKGVPLHLENGNSLFSSQAAEKITNMLLHLRVGLDTHWGEAARPARMLRASVSPLDPAEGTGSNRFALRTAHESAACPSTLPQVLLLNTGFRGREIIGLTDAPRHPQAQNTLPRTLCASFSCTKISQVPWEVNSYIMPH